MKKIKKPEKKQELIHVKLEYDELIQVKRDLLALQLSLLKILKLISKYHYLRKIEMDKKILFYNYLKNTSKNLIQLQIMLPSIKIPKILKKDYGQPKETRIKEKSSPEEVPVDSDLEMQLQEIQNRLKSLER